MNPSVSAIIVNWNHGDLILDCLDAILAQNYPLLDVTVADNGSHDGSQQKIAQRYPDLRLHTFAENRGFSAAFNWGVRNTAGDWVLSLNPDAIVRQDFLREISEALARAEETVERIGIVAPKLLQPSAMASARPSPCEDRHGLGNPPPMDSDSTPLSIIDSTGLFIDRCRRPYDRGQGQPDCGQYDTQTHIFGACGAAALYHRAMLEDLALDGEYFAEDFFAYYEDADLAWRAQLRGWRALYAPRAIATHARGRGDVLRQPGRAPKNTTGPRLALRNRYLMAARNDSAPDFLADLPRILASELPRLAYAAAARPQVLLGLLDLASALPSTLGQRRQIQRRRTVPHAHIRPWFLLSRE